MVVGFCVPLFLLGVCGVDDGEGKEVLGGWRPIKLCGESCWEASIIYYVLCSPSWLPRSVGLKQSNDTLLLCGQKELFSI